MVDSSVTAMFEKARALEQDDPAGALALYGECAAAAPDWGAPVAALGDVLRRSGRLDQSLIAYGRALELNPTDAETFLKRGNLLNDARDYDAAVADYEAAASLRPDWHLPDLNAGNALAAKGNLNAAKASYDRSLQKGGPAGIRMRRDLLLPIIPEDQHSYTAAYETYSASLDTLANDPPMLANPLAETPGARFYLAYHGRNDRVLQETLAAIYLAGCPGLDWIAPHCRTKTRRGGRRRIAIVSRFLFDHSIGRLCLGLFKRLAARGDCQLACFETAAVPDDPINREIVGLASCRMVLPGDIEAARSVVAEWEADIVFYPEIGMDPLTYFLAFARLAPVQVVSYGHPVTTGISTIDYFLSCAAGERKSADHYSEQLIALGGLPFSYVRPPTPVPLGKRSDFDLPEDQTVYFLAQNLFKIHPDMDAALLSILERDPAGIVLLLEGHDPRWGEILRRRFENSMGDTASRIVFRPRQNHEDFMRLLALSDVSLDSFPFCGGNTTYQSLAMGTPVVTLPGDYLRGRVSLAIYRHMDMEELIAQDVADYASIAVRLGRDPAYRQQIEHKAAANCAAIFEDPVFLRDAEEFLMSAVPT